MSRNGYNEKASAAREDDFIPLSALQHYLFCPRQCALIYVEQAWAENRFTAEGRVLHEATAEPGREKRGGVRAMITAMPWVSRRISASGNCRSRRDASWLIAVGVPSRSNTSAASLRRTAPTRCSFARKRWRLKRCSASRSTRPRARARSISRRAATSAVAPPARRARAQYAAPPRLPHKWRETLEPC